MASFDRELISGLTNFGTRIRVLTAKSLAEVANYSAQMSFEAAIVRTSAVLLWISVTLAISCLRQGIATSLMLHHGTRYSAKFAL